MSEDVADLIDDFDLPELDGGSREDTGSSPPAAGGGGGGERGAAASSADAPAPAPADTTQAPTPPPPAATPLPAGLLAQIREEKLREIPGETPDAALARLNTHLSQKAGRFYRQYHEEREQRQSEIAELKGMLEPILRAHFQQAQAARTEQLASQIPDRETDPTGFAAWAAEQVLIRDAQREQAAIEAQQQAQQQAAIAARQAQLADLDNRGWELLADAIGTPDAPGSDPEVGRAYEVLNAMAWESARTSYPDASDEELGEFIGLSQQLEVRQWVEQGYDPRDVLKGRLRLLETMFGRQEVQGAANALPTPPTAPPATAAPPPQQPTTSPAVTRMQQEAAAAQRRAALSPPPASRPAGLPGGQLLDPGEIEDEDEYVLAAMAGIFGDEKARAAAHRKER